VSSSVVLRDKLGGRGEVGSTSFAGVDVMALNVLDEGFRHIMIYHKANKLIYRAYAKL
jgi:hypothetical protein